MLELLGPPSLEFLIVFDECLWIKLLKFLHVGLWTCSLISFRYNEWFQVCLLPHLVHLHSKSLTFLWVPADGYWPLQFGCARIRKTVIDEFGFASTFVFDGFASILGHGRSWPIASKSHPEHSLDLTFLSIGVYDRRDSSFRLLVRSLASCLHARVRLLLFMYDRVRLFWDSMAAF